MKIAPSLYTHARVEGAAGVSILKVLTPEEATNNEFPAERTLLFDADAPMPFAGSYSTNERRRAGAIGVFAPKAANVVRPGDVVRIQDRGSLVSVVYRRGSTANTLLVTERCNSLCLMCSQPPRQDDDTWRIGELLAIIGLIDTTEPHLGFTGGEPTLLKGDFARLLVSARAQLPATRLHVLTNGRALSERDLATSLIDAGGNQTTWAVPLYGDVASVHDEIVQAEGAFHETLEGLLHLAERHAQVEIRIVLHALSLSRLPQLASYIYRRLPFAAHVAFMGIEPMGFAKKNRDRLWIDPADYVDTLRKAVHYLSVRGMNVSIYNLPHCVLSHDLWPFARASISDWKNVADPLCAPCEAREQCAGFFTSAGPAWRSRAVAPIVGRRICDELA